MRRARVAGGIGLAERVGLRQPVRQRPGAPPLRERERRLGAAPAGERRDHARRRTLWVVLAERRGGVRVSAELAGVERGAPALEVVVCPGELAFGATQVARGGPGLREPAPDGVAQEVVVGVRASEEGGEEPACGGRIPAAEGEPPAIVDNTVTHVLDTSGMRGRVRGGELALGLVPVALADRNPGQTLTADHDVLEILARRGQVEGVQKRGACRG